jgi:hypothetical protein
MPKKRKAPPEMLPLYHDRWFRVTFIKRGITRKKEGKSNKNTKGMITNSYESHHLKNNKKI